MSQIKGVTLRLPAELHKRLAYAMLERDVPSLQVLMTDLLAAWLDTTEKEAIEGYRSLPDMVYGLHAKWQGDPSSVGKAWARNFEEMEARAGVISMKERNYQGKQDVSGDSDLTVRDESAVSNSDSVSIGGKAAAGWHQVLERIFDSGDEMVIDAITHNLRAFSERAVRPNSNRNESSNIITPPAAEEKRGKNSARPEKRKKIA